MATRPQKGHIAMPPTSSLLTDFRMRHFTWVGGGVRGVTADGHISKGKKREMEAPDQVGASDPIPRGGVRTTIPSVRP